jgi:hypothetical protein
VEPKTSPLTVLRKQLSIFLLLVLLLTQYAKHISYLECRAVNFFADKNAAHCDCNRVFADTKTPDVIPDSIPRHTHIQVDENYYPFHAEWQVTDQTILRKLLFPFLEDAILNGVINEFEHPPQAG